MDRLTWLLILLVPFVLIGAQGVIAAVSAGVLTFRAPRPPVRLPRLSLVVTW